MKRIIIITICLVALCWLSVLAADVVLSLGYTVSGTDVVMSTTTTTTTTTTTQPIADCTVTGTGTFGGQSYNGAYPYFGELNGKHCYGPLVLPANTFGWISWYADGVNTYTVSSYNTGANPPPTVSASIWYLDPAGVTPAGTYQTTGSGAIGTVTVTSP